MSGFLLIKKDDSTKLEEIEDSFAESPDVFRKKGLTLAGKIVRKQFVLFSYHTYYLSEDHILEFGDDDFIMSFGTMIYKGKTGLESLRALLADFLNGTIDHFELCGHYAVIIYTRRHV